VEEQARCLDAPARKDHLQSSSWGYLIADDHQLSKSEKDMVINCDKSVWLDEKQSVMDSQTPH